MTTNTTSDPTHHQIFKEITLYCQRLYQKNLLAATDGNVSYRLNQEAIYFTPTQKHKAWIKEEEMALVTIDNKILYGQPSNERLMHLAVYQAVASARAIIHAHPPIAIAWTIAHPHLTTLPTDAMSELVLALGEVPIAPYARPTTHQMGEVLLPYLPDCKVILLARHGAISWGESLEEAYFGMERLEHAALILKAAEELGGLTKLPEEEMKILKQMRKQMGNRSL